VRKAIFIVNPVARGIPAAAKLETAIVWLEAQGWESEIQHTSYPGHATELARRAAAAGCEVVVACGGDGTVNETINGLAGTETALAVVVGGTANVWAKEMGISREPIEAVRLVAEGIRRRVDLGLVEGDEGEQRYFLLMAGVGLDAFVVKRVPARVKRWLGAATYLVWGLREGLRFRPEETSVTFDGERTTGEVGWLLASNTRSYGGVINIAPEALVDDGLLDVLLFEGHGLGTVLADAWRVFRKRYTARGVTKRRVSRIELSAPAPLDCQVDGEVLTFAPRLMRVAPLSLAVMMPAGLKSPLFSS
jgi:diacylglycerol kinase (ATP)